MAVTVSDLTQAHLASSRFREHERVERERQLMVFGKFVSEFETIWNELVGPAPAFGGHPFHSLQVRFQVVCAQADVACQAPHRVPEILRNGRCSRAIALGMPRNQTLEFALIISLVLRPGPVRISIPCGWFGA